MELDLLNSVLPTLKQNSSVITGPGDDCAVVCCGNQKLLLAVDQVTENIHFTSDTAPERAGAKLMKRNLSDIAAMGGTPLWALLTISSAERDIDYLKRFIQGVEEESEKYNVPITGGDTSSLAGSGFTASLTIIGKADAPVLRSGAKDGDYLYTTGKIGNSFLSEHHLDFTPHLSEGALLSSYANSMMDISDGLLLDAQRLAAASNVDIVIDMNAVPLRDGAAMPQALSDGEDYALIFTCGKNIDIETVFKQHNMSFVPVKIGCVRKGNGCVKVLDNGREITLENFGYEH